MTDKPMIVPKGALDELIEELKRTGEPLIVPYGIPIRKENGLIENRLGRLYCVLDLINNIKEDERFEELPEDIQEKILNGLRQIACEL